MTLMVEWLHTGNRIDSRLPSHQHASLVRLAASASCTRDLSDLIAKMTTFRQKSAGTRWNAACRPSVTAKSHVPPQVWAGNTTLPASDE